MKKLIMRLDETDQYRKNLERVVNSLQEGIGEIESKCSAVSGCWYGSPGAEFSASLSRWTQAMRVTADELENIARRVSHEREEWEKTVLANHYKGAWERFWDKVADAFDPGSWVKGEFQLKFSLKDILSPFIGGYPPVEGDTAYMNLRGYGWTKMESEGGDWDLGFRLGWDEDGGFYAGFYGDATSGSTKLTTLLLPPLPILALVTFHGPEADAKLGSEGASAGASAAGVDATFGLNIPFIDKFVGVTIGKDVGADVGLEWKDGKLSGSFMGFDIGLNLFSDPVDFTPPTPDEPIVLPGLVEIVP